MGSPEFAVPTLEALLACDVHEVVAVYTQPPREKKRGRQVLPTPVHILAEQHNIPVHCPLSLKEEAEQQTFAAYEVDVAVVVAYGLLLPTAILEGTTHGCINIHPSDLPRWRGAAPIARTILAGDTRTAMCIMQMDEGLDTGPVLDRTAYDIPAGTTTGQLHDAMARLGAERLLHVLHHYGEITPQPQHESGACYAKKIQKSEALLDFTQDAAIVLQQILGLSPYPGAYFLHNGERIKILDATMDISHHISPGTLHIEDKKLQIGCKNGSIFPTMVQKPGKKPQSVNAFLNGFRV